MNPEYANTYVSERANDEQTRDADSVQVFPNDYPALLPPPLPQMPTESPADGPNLFQQQPVLGSCQVICFHPRHDMTLARMPAPAIRAVLSEWARVYVEEGDKMRAVGDEGYVQFFEVSERESICWLLNHCRTVER